MTTILKSGWLVINRNVNFEVFATKCIRLKLNYYISKQVALQNPMAIRELNVWFLQFMCR